jgi:hypothetical protein
MLVAFDLFNCFQFAEEFRDQFTSERLEFMDEIEHNIRNCVDERYKRGQGSSGIGCVNALVVCDCGQALLRPGLTIQRSGFALVGAIQAVEAIKLLDPKKKPK